ncbi:hypothetical protein GCM10023321_50110 [Pseudonocardia eucalypti]|uniref:DUF4232 domain-containing protein n=1 Tax=Pseudonocardia eucalypti TaxID=648755 RepID=A0ABP9QKG5_9PSEU
MSGYFAVTIPGLFRPGLPWQLTARISLRIGYALVGMSVALLAACAPSPPPLGKAFSGSHLCTRAEAAASLSDEGAPTDVFTRPDDLAFQCATFSVPLDHGLLGGQRQPGRLELPVAVAGNSTAPKGVLMWLVVGSGEPGVRLTAENRQAIRPSGTGPVPAGDVLRTRYRPRRAALPGVATGSG